MVRVLHINCNYVGTKLHRTMISHLDNEELKSTIFAPIWNESEKEKFDPKPNEKVAVCFHKWDRLLYFLKQKKLLNAVRNHCNPVESFSCIHAHTLMTDGYVALKLNKLYGIPYIVSVRDTDINSFFRIKPYLIPIGIQVLRSSSAVVFLSESYQDTMLSKYVPKRLRQVVLSKSYIIPNGIDDFWINNCFEKPDLLMTADRLKMKEIKVLTVAKVNKTKNLPYLIEAFNMLRSKGWNIEHTIIGEKQDAKEYQKIAEDKNTIYIGPMDKTKLLSFYRKADIFALASHHETFGLVYAEAMSQCLPVLYTRGQGFDGQFKEGIVGYSISDQNPLDVAKALELICENYISIATNGPHYVSNFVWDDICEKYRELYKGVSDVSN